MKQKLASQSKIKIMELINKFNTDHPESPIEKVSFNDNFVNRRCLEWKQVLDPETGMYNLVCKRWGN